MWCRQAVPRSTPIHRRALVVTDLLTRSAVRRVDRDADWVFRELHDPKALMSCVPGGRITRILDARRFEARVVAGVGPFKIAYAGTGQIKDSDPGSRTASLTIAGRGIGMPPSRVRMAMVVSSLDAGAALHLSFRMTTERTLLTPAPSAHILTAPPCPT